MVVAIERERTVGGYDLLDAAAHQQLPWVPMSAADACRDVPEGEITRPLADRVERAPGWGSIGVPDLADVEIQKLSNVQAKLKDFAAGNEISAVAALIVRLNAEFRKAARSDRSAALNVEIAAQEAAAKALRNTGLCQLFGAIATSGGAMLGAGVNLKGARQIQARFDELYKAKIQTPLPKSGLETPAPNSPSGRAQRFDKPEGEPEVCDKPHGKAQLTQAPEREARPSDDNVEMTGLDGSTSSSRGNTPGDPLRLDAPDSTTDPLEFTRVVQAQTAAQQAAMRWNGMGTIATEAFKLPGAGLNMGATHYQEEKARLEADGTKARAQVEEESEFMASYETVVQDFLGKLAEIRRADTEARSKIVSMA
ncbi:hypothetical protein [Bradyrhizobium elkanii]|uniref:hypothetical protein n=1 Tax=Bradyrhizobium elkanii TaxID=29448 RepID=UPI002226D5BA|nr:hypothetical protein [Bradyrhizobium elkanii]MCW2130694.1 hypothetical protein [Bradyrhizobium elkanii]MCW2176045.1 hypothetical protein [Bradyrhizobium elkanii]